MKTLMLLLLLGCAQEAPNPCPGCQPVTVGESMVVACQAVLFMTVPKMIKLYQYNLPSIDGLEGWANIIIGENGFFAAVSDYGNYAYRWTHFGTGDFRVWLLDIEPDYLAGKISRRNAFDLEGSIAIAKQHIIEIRRECR